MEIQIQNFTNQLFGTVRVLNNNEEPWFVATDIAKILGYSDATHLTRNIIDPRDKGLQKVETPGGIQSLTVINESGLYAAIFSSRLPAAIEFKHWVTSEVLPTMRKIGFNRSMQVLQEENMRLQGLVEGYQNSNLASNVDRVEVIEMRNQIIDKLYNIPIGTPITQEIKQFLIQYDPNWEG